MAGMYGMPVDSGPMAFYYDKEVFDKAGISEPPSTWDEFYQDAKKIKQIGSYITNDQGTPVLQCNGLASRWTPIFHI